MARPFYVLTFKPRIKICDTEVILTSDLTQYFACKLKRRDFVESRFTFVAKNRPEFLETLLNAYNTLMRALRRTKLYLSRLGLHELNCYLIHSLCCQFTSFFNLYSKRFLIYRLFSCFQYRLENLYSFRLRKYILRPKLLQ